MEEIQPTRWYNPRKKIGYDILLISTALFHHGDFSKKKKKRHYVFQKDETVSNLPVVFCSHRNSQLLSHESSCLINRDTYVHTHIYIYIYIMDYNGLWSKPHVTELYYTSISHPLVYPRGSRGQNTSTANTPRPPSGRVSFHVANAFATRTETAWVMQIPGKLTQLERMARLRSSYL